MENMFKALSDTNLYIDSVQRGMAKNSIQICVRESNSPKMTFERKTGEAAVANDYKTAKNPNKIEIIATYELCNVAKYSRAGATPVKQSNFQKPRRRPRHVAARWKFSEDPERIEVLSTHEIPSEQEARNSDMGEEIGCVNGRREVSSSRNHGLEVKPKNFYQRVKFQVRRFLCLCKNVDS